MCECKDGPLKITTQTGHGYHHEIKLLLTYFMSVPPPGVPFCRVKNHGHFVRDAIECYFPVFYFFDHTIQSC